MSETARRFKDSATYVVLKEFGLPTLLALVAWWTLSRNMEADRVERRELLSRLAAGVEAQVATLRELRDAERAHADAVAATATWPRLRLPPAARYVSNPQSGETP